MKPLWNHSKMSLSHFLNLFSVFFYLFSFKINSSSIQASFIFPTLIFSFHPVSLSLKSFYYFFFLFFYELWRLIFLFLVEFFLLLCVSVALARLFTQRTRLELFFFSFLFVYVRNWNSACFWWKWSFLDASFVCLDIFLLLLDILDVFFNDWIENLCEDLFIDLKWLLWLSLKFIGIWGIFFKFNLKIYFKFSNYSVFYHKVSLT